MGVIFAFTCFSILRNNYPHAKIKPIWLYEENRSSIVKITPWWNVFPLFSRNFPPAKITSFSIMVNENYWKLSFHWYMTIVRSMKTTENFLFIDTLLLYGQWKLLKTFFSLIHDYCTNNFTGSWGEADRLRVRKSGRWKPTDPSFYPVLCRSTGDSLFLLFLFFSFPP